MNYNIQNMAYSDTCVGTSIIDQSSLEEVTGDEIPFGINTAYAQKFIPTSLCLESIVLKLRKESATAGVGATVRICEDSNGFPNYPASNLGEVTISDTGLQTEYTEVNFPVNILLNDIKPYWIVVTTSNYDPSVSDTTVYISSAAKFLTTIDNNLSGKYGNNSWIHNYAKFVFKTFKIDGIVEKWKCTNPNGASGSKCTSGTDSTYKYDDQVTCENNCQSSGKNNGNSYSGGISAGSALVLAAAGIGILYLLTKGKKTK